MRNMSIRCAFSDLYLDEVPENLCANMRSKRQNPTKQKRDEEKIPRKMECNRYL